MKELTTQEAIKHIAKEHNLNTHSEIAKFCSTYRVKFTPTMINNYLNKGVRMGVTNTIVMRDKFKIKITDTYGVVLDD